MEEKTLEEIIKPLAADEGNIEHAGGGGSDIRKGV